MRYEIVRTKSGFHVVKHPTGYFNPYAGGIAVSTKPVSCGFGVTQEAAEAIKRLLEP